jgi:NAD(P)-dependent dehydrogenase (short-subunit alcohol dehydrogenase family)
MNRSELPMTSSEPGHVDIIESHAGIECGQGFEVPVTAPQFGGHQVVISAAATGPWDAFNGHGTTVEAMKIVVIGATGTIGTAVTNALESAHQIVRASRHGPDKVDMGDPPSIAALFESVNDIDAIVCCAASVKPTPLASLCDDDVALAIQAKLLGQVNLLRQALRHLRDGGSITLTAGAFVQPTYGRAICALVNAGVRCFVRAAAAEMPRSLRLNVVSPARVKETLEQLGLDSAGALPARDIARAYVVAVEGMLQGQTIVPTAL